ncbi:hypothetical protein RF11_11576 [Thelohanellus kitauei]|uniref:Uncharacterized protein n=1 Tax=Thelohanellus kitauei TaxID=669202 RepID=A0A0C2NIW8_THEKT|nr:hypothetical protein RF11_11576 [Thelohanellus kitauei]
MDIKNEQVMTKHRNCYFMSSVCAFLLMLEDFDDLETIHYNEFKRYQTFIEIRHLSILIHLRFIVNLVYIFVECSFDGGDFRRTDSLEKFHLPHIDDYDDDKPYPISLCSLISNDESLYMLGTDTHHVREDQCEYEMFSFSLKTSKWSKQYPEDRFDESFAFSSKFGYMRREVCPLTFTRYSDIWRFELDTLEWLKLDKIAECDNLHHVFTSFDPG